MKKPDAVPSPKEALIQIRVTSAQKAEWQAAAEADRRKLADWLRLAAEAYMHTGKTGATMSRRPVTPSRYNSSREGARR